MPSATLSRTEQQYVDLKVRMIAAVCSVHGVISAAENDCLDRLRARLGEAEIDRLDDLARYRFQREG